MVQLDSCSVLWKLWATRLSCLLLYDQCPFCIKRNARTCLGAIQHQYVVRQLIIRKFMISRWQKPSCPPGISYNNSNVALSGVRGRAMCLVCNHLQPSLH